MYSIQILVVCLTVTSSFGLPAFDNVTASRRIEEANKNAHLKDTIGDMKLNQQQTKVLKPGVGHAVITGSNFKWPTTVIPYVISPSFTPNEVSIIMASAAEIASKSCVRLQKHDSAAGLTDYVDVIKESGCWSWIGRQNTGRQELSLGDGCVFNSVVSHEFLHALGFFHEQSRTDRDNYVEIKYENIQEGAEDQFKIQQDSDNQGTVYDPISIMHYERTEFSKNDLPTIVWKADNALKLGNVKLSTIDFDEVNSFYCGGATPNPPSTTTTTKPPTTKTTDIPPTTKTTDKPPTTRSTNKPPTTTTGQPGNGFCGDFYYDCIYDKEAGFCPETASECPYSCGVCTGPESERCKNYEDYFSKRRCERLVARGGCQHFDVKLDCSRSCCKAGKLFD